MSNRRRRCLRVSYPVDGDRLEVLLAALTYRCPDCDNDVVPIGIKGIVAHVQVQHDETCPWLAARTV